MKKILAVIVVAVALGGGVKWYKKHQLEVEAKEVAALMKGASSAVVQQVAFFKDPHGETHAEVLESAESAIKRVGGLIEKLETRADVRDGILVTHALDYLKTSQEAARGIRQVVRLKVSIGATVKAMSRTAGVLQDFAESPHTPGEEFRFESAMGDAAPLIRKSREEDEALNIAAEALGKTLSKLVALRNAKPNILPLDAYVTDESVTGITFSVR